MPNIPDRATSIPWDQLVNDIHDHRVLPIIGPTIVTVEENGRSIPLIDAVVPQFARQHGIDFKPGMTLNEAACKYREQERDEAKRLTIYSTVRTLVKDRSEAPVPQALLDLAAITDFDAIVSTTFDGFLSRALEQARPGWSPAKGRAVLHPNEIVDIPDSSPGTFLYHVLGAVDHHTSSFAIWEEDYMEYLAALLSSHKDNLRNLIGLLRNRSLLLIGSPFRDWFIRFFLYIAKRSGIALRNDRSSAYFADLRGKDDPLVIYFDKVIGSPQILPMEPCAFVAELRERWSEKFALSPQGLIANLPTDMPRGYVFISYASEDEVAAFTLALGLHNANIPVWLDKCRLEAGTDWEAALRRAIKQRAALFLSLISSTTENFGEGEGSERFVMKERQWAAERHEPGFVFYVPVLISPGTTTQQREPEVFRRLQCAKAPAGKINPEFIARIAAYMDEYKDKGEITHAP